MRRLLVAAALMLAAVPALADALLITEFKAASGSNPVYYQAATTPAVANQSVIITPNSSVQSAAFNSATGLIRVMCVTTDPADQCNIEIGTNPTANGISLRLNNGQTEYFVVKPGAILAVYQPGPV